MHFPVRRYLALLVTYLKPQWRRTLLMAALLFCNVGLQLLGPQILRYFIDTILHKAHTPGELIERIDGNVDALSNFFSQFVIYLLTNIVLLLGVLIALYLADWRAGLLMTTDTAINRCSDCGIESRGTKNERDADDIALILCPPEGA